MFFDVTVQSLARREELVTQSTFVQPLAEVGHLVHLKDVVVTECFVADITGVGLFSCVGADVHFQLFAAGKGLHAVRAGVRLLTGMSSHVDYKLTGLDEGLTAHLIKNVKNYKY